MEGKLLSVKNYTQQSECFKKYLFVMIVIPLVVLVEECEAVHMLCFEEMKG